MERKHVKPIPRSKKERIGQPTGLLDCNHNEIITGDVVRLKGTGYQGRVMWNRHCDKYGIFLDYSLWYRGMNPYDPDCYGKFVEIPQDNGMRMELELVKVSRREDESIWR